MRSSRDLLAAPCVFCGYNGSGYWQPETHAKHCPWHDLGGSDERAAQLRAVMVRLVMENRTFLHQFAEHAAAASASPSAQAPAHGGHVSATPHLDRWLIDGGRAVLIEHDRSFGREGWVASTVALLDSAYAYVHGDPSGIEGRWTTKARALMELDLMLKRQAEEVLGLREHECETE